MSTQSCFTAQDAEVQKAAVSHAASAGGAGTCSAPEPSQPSLHFTMAFLFHL